LFLEQLLDLFQELQEFLGLPVCIQTKLVFEPTLPDLHPLVIVPVQLCTGPLAFDPSPVFLIFLPAVPAKPIGPKALTPLLGFLFHLTAALGTFQEASGTLKDLLQGIQLAFTEALVPGGLQILSLLVKFNDVGHGR
jgi:hypothetical protein